MQWNLFYRCFPTFKLTHLSAYGYWVLFMIIFSSPMSHFTSTAFCLLIELMALHGGAWVTWFYKSDTDSFNPEYSLIIFVRWANALIFQRSLLKKMLNLIHAVFYYSLNWVQSWTSKVNDVEPRRVGRPKKK